MYGFCTSMAFFMHNLLMSCVSLPPRGTCASFAALGVSASGANDGFEVWGLGLNITQNHYTKCGDPPLRASTSVEASASAPASFKLEFCQIARRGGGGRWGSSSGVGVLGLECLGHSP